MCVDKKESTCNRCYPFIHELRTRTRWSVGTSCYCNMYMKCILKESYYKYLVQHTLLFKYSHQHFVLQDAEENGAVEGNDTKSIMLFSCSCIGFSVNYYGHSINNIIDISIYTCLRQKIKKM